MPLQLFHESVSLIVAFMMMMMMMTIMMINIIVRKGKERKSIYIAPFCTKLHTKRSGMDHTVLPANNAMPAFPS